MSIQKAAEQALEESLAELAADEIQLMEATAHAQNAREVVLRLKNAVAALNGETPTSSSQEQVIPDNAPLRAERVETSAMTPEEFEAERKRKLRRREKEEIENNPLGHLKCPGCGVAGKMSDQIMTTKGGGTVRMLECGGCHNQQLAG